MAVVINDMEVAPQPSVPSAASAPASGATAATPRDELKRLEKEWHRQRRRAARLEAR